MIMPTGQQLLLPANPLFVWGSLIVALFVNMLSATAMGRSPWVPDILAVVIVFWTVHQPLRVGIGAAFLFGVAMDVHQGALLGQHALSYTALSFFAITVHRRLLWFSVPSQAVQVLPLLVAATALQLFVRLLAGHGLPGWSIVVAPLIEAALWPIISIILLAPQRRAPDPDANRPL
jgi:rod shape-determining protein MreD